MVGVDVLSRIVNGVLSGGGLGGVVGGMMGGGMTQGGVGGVPVGERGSRTMALAALVVFLTHGRGGAQGLRALVDALHRVGLTRQVNSWIDRGPNAAVQPDELRRAFSGEALNAVSRGTGLREDELLADLARGLPAFVEKLCPLGRLPRSDAEIPEMPEDDLLDELGRGAAANEQAGRDQPSA
jgi:uncharacterized protein YidB (DUF937 family)